MFTLYIIGISIAYISMGGIVSGYISGKDNVHDTEAQLILLFIWPILIAFWPASLLFDLSRNIAEKQKQKRLAKEALEKKTRIEMEEIESSIDAELSDHNDEEEDDFDWEEDEA